MSGTLKCAKCGHTFEQYADETVSIGDEFMEHVYVCPACGHRHPVLKSNIFVYVRVTYDLPDTDFCAVRGSMQTEIFETPPYVYLGSISPLPPPDDGWLIPDQDLDSPET